MKRKLNLSPEAEHQILASIRSGGYAHVAAAAWGVPKYRWEKWRERGTGERARRPYRDLFRKVEQAQAQARLKVEMEAMEADPRGWLKHGPGKEQPGNPGWTALAKPSPAGRSDSFTAQDLLELFAALRKVLAPFPDALAVVVRTMQASYDRRKSSTSEGADGGLAWADPACRNQPTFGTSPPQGKMEEPDETEEYDS